MDKGEFREHCEKQIERCIKLNDSRHLKEHELALGLLNENDRLIQENQKYKEVIDRLNKLAGIRLLTMYFEDGGEISVLPYEDLLDILEEVE